MAEQLRAFDSFGGFSVENTTLISPTKDIQNVNSLEVKNKFFADAASSHYILRGTTTAVLALDDTAGQIPVPSSSINFITGHIIGVNNTGAGHLSTKIESTVYVSPSGAVNELSNLTTIIKDSVPLGETWTVELFDSGASNRVSYTATKQGGVAGQTIKWLAYVQVVSIDWT